MCAKKANPNEPPEVVELFRAIAALVPTAKSLQAQLLRYVDIEFAKRRDFFSGRGAYLFGGRWNPVGVRAIYASLDVQTATAEAFQNELAFGITKPAMRPKVVAGARISVSKSIDLHEIPLDATLGFSVSELLKEEWQAIQGCGEESWGQAIGRGCQQAGFEALIVPSARRRGGKNIVVFRQNFHKSSTFKIEHQNLLPK